MSELTSENDYRNRTRGKFLISLIFSCLFLLLISCSDSTVNTAETASHTEKLVSLNKIDHNSFLSSGNFSGLASKTNKSPVRSSQKIKSEGFVSPLFSLTTAPNGDILVADAGAGIITLDGTDDIPLPGVTDMSPIGRGSMWAIKGLTGEPGEETGQALYRVSQGKNRVIADLFAFEQEYNPDGATLIDSNPFDVHSFDGQTALVVDAAGNDLLRIDNQGHIEVVAVFPNELVSTSNVKSLVGCPMGPAGICGLPDEISAQPVPTSIAVGPDGSYYIGELKGFPAPTGESNIWRISPDASDVMCGAGPDCMKAFDGGFTSIIDMSFDDQGNLYVVELDENSWFALEIGSGILAGGTINKCDLEAGTCVEVASGIPILTAITFGNDGTLWATRNALIPGAAEVFMVE
ncbi:ScyD/ScyE family protein [Fodinibius sp. Rm-B-1B1-1]|uniref:ScyD/ScyE family protein n=1 Tax=Fodinibius alkaliphilus TaxID=3140241 RepID=UPI00315A22BF